MGVWNGRVHRWTLASVIKYRIPQRSLILLLFLTNFLVWWLALKESVPALLDIV
ncbi:hypothetical protein IIA15_08845 [candidate division TA06 bacterium]|nr:hypothetical protein [candidate division TA06 bacterium]